MHESEEKKILSKFRSILKKILKITQKNSGRKKMKIEEKNIL
jgi:hypothetical protein